MQNNTLMYFVVSTVDKMDSNKLQYAILVYINIIDFKCLYIADNLILYNTSMDK